MVPFAFNDHISFVGLEQYLYAYDFQSHTSFLNSRSVYPTASLTSTLGCLIEILNKLVKKRAPDLFPTLTPPKLLLLQFCSSPSTVAPPCQWLKPRSLKSFSTLLFFSHLICNPSGNYVNSAFQYIQSLTTSQHLHLYIILAKSLASVVQITT